MVRIPRDVGYDGQPVGVLIVAADAIFKNSAPRRLLDLGGLANPVFWCPGFFLGFLLNGKDSDRISLLGLAHRGGVVGLRNLGFSARLRPSLVSRLYPLGERGERFLYRRCSQMRRG